MRRGFTFIELLIVISSLCGLIGGLGKGWGFGLGWSLVYGLLGLVLGLSVIVVPIFAFGAGYHAFQSVFGKPGDGKSGEGNSTVDPSEENDGEEA